MFAMHGMMAGAESGEEGKLLVPKALLSSSSNNSSYMFQSVDLGNAAADRSIFVVCCGSVGSNNTPNTCTVAGNSATRRVVRSGLASVAIFNLNLTTGSSGNVVIGFSRSMARCGGYVFAAYGLDSLVPIDSGTDTGGSASIELLGLDATGFVLGITHGISSPYENVSQSFTGQTDVQSGNIDGADTVISYSGPGIGSSITMTGSGGAYTRYAFAAFS